MTFNNPKLSIIIPVYNAEDFLVTCIESVIKQTFSNYELILINDGSEDKSAEICEQFSLIDKRIKVFHTENKGASYARNFGLRIARGEFIAFMDSDDTICSNMYESMIEVIEKDKSDIVACGYKEINYLLGEERSHIYPLGSFTILEEEKIKQSLEYFLKNNKMLGYASLWNKIYRRKIIVDNNLFLNENMKFAEDLCFNLNLLVRVKKITAINEAFYHYRRINPSSLMNSDVNFKELFASREAMLEEILNCGLNDEVCYYCLGYENANTITSYVGRMKDVMVSSKTLLTKLKEMNFLLKESYLSNALSYYNKDIMTTKVKIVSYFLEKLFSFRVVKKF